MAEARRQWRERQPGLDPKRLVFIDESGFTTTRARRRGRSPRGERPIASIPHGHWKTLTFIAGLRHGRIVAPIVLDGPHGWRRLPCLCGESPRPHALARRHCRGR